MPTQSLADCPIIFATDRTYCMPLAVTLRSLAETNTSGQLQCYILAGSLTPEDRRRVEESLPAGALRLTWVDIDLNEISGYRISDHVTTMTYARLLLPRILPPETRRAIYLDCDILVCSDLSYLAEADLGDATIGAVMDPIDALIKQDDPKAEGLPRVEKYFNAGVLVIDMERWRHRGVSERAHEYLIGNPETPFWDQDALNVACDGSWVALDEAWNFQRHLTLPLHEARRTVAPRIIHYISSTKPWLPWNISDYASQYGRVRERTRFRKSPAERVRDGILALWIRFKHLVRDLPPVKTLRRRRSAHLCGNQG